MVIRVSETGRQITEHLVVFGVFSAYFENTKVKANLRDMETKADQLQMLSSVPHEPVQIGGLCTDNETLRKRHLIIGFL